MVTNLGLQTGDNDKTVSKIITKCYSLGLKEVFNTPHTNNILVKFFSVGFGEGTPTNIKIYRHRK